MVTMKTWLWLLVLGVVLYKAAQAPPPPFVSSLYDTEGF
jgi:hypothetical protein